MAQVACPHCGSHRAMQAVVCGDCQATLPVARPERSEDPPPSLAGAQEAARTGRNDEALRLYEEVAAWATGREGTDAKSALVEALAGLAEIQFRLGVYDEVHRACARVHEAASSDLHRAVAERWLALACHRQGRLDEMSEHLSTGIALARSAGVSGRELLGLALCDEANRLRRAGDVDTAMDHLHEVRRIVGLCLGANRLLAYADIVEGRIARRSGEFHRAVVLYTRAQAMAEELGNTVLWVQAAQGLGNLRRSLGDLERARRPLEQARRMSKQIGDVELLLGAAIALGNVAWAQKDLATARRCNEEALATWEQAGNVSGMATAKANLAKLALQEGDLAAAVQSARASLALLEGGVNENLRARVASDLAAVQVALGEAEDARATYEAIVEEFSEVAHPRAVAKARRGLGLLALGAGEFGRACAMFQTAIDILTLAKDEKRAAQVRMSLVEALRGAERVKEARFELMRARGQFTLLDSKEDLASVAELERTLES